MRGSVHRLRANRQARGHEQRGRRYAVMVSATRFEHLSTWVVVPTTTSPHARPGLLHPAVDWGDGESTVLCEAVRAVDPQLRLAEQVGYLGVEEMQAIDRGLAALLDLNPPSF